MADAGRMLDKKHGFLRQIIKNQIERDEYDRQLKARQRTKEHAKKASPRTPVYVPPHRRKAAGESSPNAGCAAENGGSGSRSNRRTVEDQSEMCHSELMDTYRDKARMRIARQLRQRDERADSPPVLATKSPRTVVETNEPLFTLQLLDQHGETHTCLIRKNDSAARVAKKYCVSLGLNDAFAARLRRQIEQRMAAHCGGGGGRAENDGGEVVLSSSEAEDS